MGFSDIGIAWSVGVASGWGTYGANLAFELARRGIAPALFFLARRSNLTKTQESVLAQAIAKHSHWNAEAKRAPLSLGFPVLHALSDKLYFPDMLPGLKGRPNIGVVFFETAAIPAENIAAARAFDAIITGSTWNADVLKQHGVANVRNCPQGVDLTLFKPGPRLGKFANRFTVFSGGKLEYRKGQDLVVAAFKQFHARHPDALLVTAWHNPWPEAAAGLSVSPHVAGPPGLTPDGGLDVPGWLHANGLPEDAVHELPLLPNEATPAVLQEMDLAVFPSRCEGGTNLVAMEAMACGVPTVLSRNTGHIDLIRPDNCFSLDFQIPMGEITQRPDLDGWGESSIDELMRKMDEAYSDRAEARRRGAAGAAFMRGWGWPAQVDGLLAALKEFCP